MDIQCYKKGLILLKDSWIRIEYTNFYFKKTINFLVLKFENSG